MNPNLGENGTTTAFYPHPDNSIPTQTRDTYLLIATFVSVLIIMGIVMAFINRKCRHSLSRARFRLLHLRHHDVLTTGRRRRPQIATSESMIHHVHNLHDPNSPVYSKEVNAPVSFFAEKRAVPNGLERIGMKTRSSNSMYDSESCSSCLDSGISVISNKTGIPTCSMPKYHSTGDRTQKKQARPTLTLAPDVKLVRVLMPETMDEDSADAYNDLIYHQEQDWTKSTPTGDSKNYNVRLNDSYNNRNIDELHTGLTRNRLEDDAVYRTRSPKRKPLDEFDHQSSFNVKSLNSIEDPFDENFNNVQDLDSCSLSKGKLYIETFDSKFQRKTKLNAGGFGAIRFDEKHSSSKHTERSKGSGRTSGKIRVASKPPVIRKSASRPEDRENIWSTSKPVVMISSASPVRDHFLDNDVLCYKKGDTTNSQNERHSGLDNLLPSLQEFGEFLQERRRNLSFSN
ncbi:uncharacterized protein LOC125679344 [Ostrea edulis]|uniref:uncharacterized protein LOC125679344 n=1 Tax=Ostrea edulis TaxID=37623 RepID=UPI0024AFF2D3|nr:uncharacterized protein LOC125679344 [Ostrea edulis]